MKYLIALTLLLAGAAQAQQPATPITLMSANGFGALHQYYNVATDAVPLNPVTMYLPQSTSTGGMSLYFALEGIAANDPTRTNYKWQGTYNGSGVDSVLSRWVCTGPDVNLGGYYGQLCNLTGEQMTLLIYESSRLVRGSGSGRGGYASHRVWTLAGGTITFN